MVLHCIALSCVSLHCTALHCIELCCIALHCPALPLVALPLVELPLSCVCARCVSVRAPWMGVALVVVRPRSFGIQGSKDMAYTLWPIPYGLYLMARALWTVRHRPCITAFASRPMCEGLCFGIRVYGLWVPI